MDLIKEEMSAFLLSLELQGQRKMQGSLILAQQALQKQLYDKDALSFMYNRFNLPPLNIWKGLFSRGKWLLDGKANPCLQFLWKTPNFYEEQ